MKFLKYFYILFLCIITIACENRMGSNANEGKLGTKINNLKNNNLPKMDIDWKIDGAPANGGLEQLFQDQGWHLITMTVTDTESRTKPVEVKGLLSAVYPKPDKDVGQKISITDLDCKQAIFSKIGDNCSAYIRFSFDETKAGLDNVVFNAQFAPAGNISALLSFKATLRQTRSIGNIRPVLLSESQYYTGSTIISSKLSYRILLVQNNSHLPFSLTTLNQTSSTFDLMHRSSNSESDPIYGKYPECSLTANENLLQVNTLKDLYDSCLLIYKAPENSSTDIQSDTINIDTNAIYTFPSKYKKFQLKARYEHGMPIPSQTKDGANFMVATGKAHSEGAWMKMDTAGTLIADTTQTFYPFRLVNLDYTFSPGTVFYRTSAIPLYSDGMLNIVEDTRKTSLISPGTQILTDASTTNPVTVGSVNAKVPEPSQLHATEEVYACGGAYTLATTAIKSDVNLARNGWIHVAVGIISTALCANRDVALYENNLPFNTNETITVYNVNERGCGGGNWDIGGVVTIRNNGCDDYNCSITTNLMAEHNGVGDQCRDRQSKEFTLTFKRPQVYLELSNLSNFNPKYSDAQAIALGGQKLRASIGGVSGSVAQNINCTFSALNNPFCHGVGTYSNGLSSTFMSYFTDLLDQDVLWSGTVDFTRSSGYDLADFIISAED